MEEIDVGPALGRIEIMPIAHPASKRMREKAGKVDRQNLDRNRRLIAEEDKEGPDNQA